MILLENLPPKANKTVAVALGRFSPPTIGHYAIFDSIKAFTRKHKNVDPIPVVIVIGGNKSDLDTNRNPLTVTERISFMQGSGLANGVKFIHAKNVFEGFASLRAHGFEPYAIAAGDDRAEDYLRILNQYFNDGDKKLPHVKIQLPRNKESTSGSKEDKESHMEDILTLFKKTGKIPLTDISASLARFAVKKGEFSMFNYIVGGNSKNQKLVNKMFKKIKQQLET